MSRKLNIAIVAATGNNFASLQNTFKRLNVSSIVTNDQEIIKSASHVILPGVGHAEVAIKKLRQFQLDTLIPQLTQPVLAICLGMQLLFTYLEEGECVGLKIIPGEVQSLAAKDVTIPHMGWNTIHFNQENLLFKNIKNASYFYFIHSYAVAVNGYTTASCKHGIDFSASIQHDNFYATQFHPERSGEVGQKLFENFLAL